MSIASWTSPPASALTFPISRVIRSVRSSFAFSSRRAKRKRISPRFGAGTRRQSSKAVFAAATARSTSSAVDFGKTPSVSPVAGLTLSKVSPLAASTHSPPMKFLNVFVSVVAMPAILRMRCREGPAQAVDELPLPRAVLAGEQLEAIREPPRPEQPREADRHRRRDVAVAGAGREEEARAEPQDEARVVQQEQRRIVGGELRRRGVAERPVGERAEVAAPGFDAAEEPRVAERDVDGAEPARREPGDRPVVGDGEVRGRPRKDAADEVVLPRPGPLAVVVATRPRRRHDGDEGPRLPAPDQAVGDGGEAETPHVGPRRARHPGEEVDDGIAPRPRVARRDVDHRGPPRAGDRPAPDLAAPGADGDDVEPGWRRRKS